MDLKELLGEELFNQVKSKLGDKKVAVVSDGNWIPKDKFNTVNEELKEVKGQITERDKQLNDLKKKAGNNEELTEQINQLQEQNKTTKDEYEKKIKQLQKETAIDLFLKDFKVKNSKAVKALLDLDNVSVEGDEVKGLKEQMEALKESDSYLFDTGQTTFKGATPPKGSDTPPGDLSTGESFAKQLNDKQKEGSSNFWSR